MPPLALEQSTRHTASPGQPASPAPSFLGLALTLALALTIPALAIPALAQDQPAPPPPAQAAQTPAQDANPAPGPAQARETLVELPTRPGVTQRFLLLNPGNPVACVVLFAGGDGALGLSGQPGGPGAMASLGGNFLVRSRAMFAARGLAVATVDAPSDRQGGMGDDFRSGAAHAQDLAAVAAYLHQATGRPVWLAGTSRGTVSAASLAVRLGRDIDGLVLTSTITRSMRGKKTPVLLNGVFSLDLAEIRVPTLVLAHADDQCEITPPRDVSRLAEKLKNAAKVETKVLDGGDPPISGPCEARSGHGFLGVEEQAVTAMADFIRANSRP